MRLLTNIIRNTRHENELNSLTLEESVTRLRSAWNYWPRLNGTYNAAEADVLPERAAQIVMEACKVRAGTLTEEDFINSIRVDGDTNCPPTFQQVLNAYSELADHATRDPHGSLAILKQASANLRSKNAAKTLEGQPIPGRFEIAERIRPVFTRRLRDRDDVDNLIDKACEIVLEAYKVKSGTQAEADFLNNMGLRGAVDFTYTAELVLDAYANLTDSEAFRALRHAAVLHQAKQSGFGVRG